MPSLRPPSPSAWDPHRREVLRLIAAGAAASLAGCSKPDQPIVPAVHDAEGDRAGRVRRYATTLPLSGYGRGATALVVDGRPIKLEGSPRHPASLDSTDMFVEASILDLYDPQRLRAPQGPKGIGGWEMLERTLIEHVPARGGEGVALLTGRITSPTLLARIAEAKMRLPGLRHVRYEAIDDDAERAGAAMAFGRPLTMRPRLRDADLLILLDADPLGPGPDQIAFGRAWSDRRRNRSRRAPRAYAFEPSLTASGICADRRVALHPALVPNVLLALAGRDGGEAPEDVTRMVALARADLAAARGRAIVLVGRGQPPEVHAFAAWLNQSIGAPVDWIEPVDPDPSGHAQSLAALARDMHDGRVATLIVLDANPVYHAPPALGFAEAMKRAPLSIAFAAFPDETASAATWRAPLTHPLESWGDARAPDGTASLIQPMVKPLFGARSPLEAIGMIDAASPRIDDHARVQAQWRGRAGGDPGRWWRDALVAGVIEGTAASPVSPGGAKPPSLVPARPPTAMIVTLPPSSTMWDGRFATNAWAQECPDPIVKEVWASSLRLSAADAKRLGVEDSDIVRFGGVMAPVRILPGQAEGVATLPLGRGRSAGGPIATAASADGFRLRPASGGFVSPPLTIEKTDWRHDVPTAQAIIEAEGPLADHFPLVAPGKGMRPADKLSSLIGDDITPPDAGPDYARPEAPQWGMVIDTSVCIGCNACVVACQAENNVPSIGADQIMRGRDMHWLRVDRYEHEGGGGFQPVPCMMCEKAPCEPVCPVEAPTHTAEGLNLQVYNR